MNNKNIFTLNEFLEEYRISRATFFKLRKLKKAPRIIKLKGKILISREAALKWQRNLESDRIEI